MKPIDVSLYLTYANPEDIEKQIEELLNLSVFISENASHIHAKAVYGGRSGEEVRELWEKWKTRESLS